MPDDDNDVEIAVLKQQIDHLKERLEEKDKETFRRLGSLEEKMDEILLAHSRYRGAWGMLLMLTSAIWAGVVFMKDFFVKGKA